MGNILSVVLVSISIFSLFMHVMHTESMSFTCCNPLAYFIVEFFWIMNNHVMINLTTSIYKLIFLYIFIYLWAHTTELFSILFNSSASLHIKGDIFMLFFLKYFKSFSLLTKKKRPQKIFRKKKEKELKCRKK